MSIAPTSESAEGVESVARHVGLRMSAEEFLKIPDDGVFYELIDGVVVMSPSPTPEHQQAVMEIARQIANYIRQNKVGRVFPEQDVHLGPGKSGRDIVYRPEVTFVAQEKLADNRGVLRGPPDVVVEVISRGSRRMDTETKFRDYEQFGVREYWLVDPENSQFHFYRVNGGKFVEGPAEGERFSSEAIPGFLLEIADVREALKPW